jgi:hypothetical protein
LDLKLLLLNVDVQARHNRTNVAAADGLERIDAGTIERVWRDLLPGPIPRPTTAAAADDGLVPPVNPRVRVVRRLGE